MFYFVFFNLFTVYIIIIYHNIKIRFIYTLVMEDNDWCVITGLVQMNEKLGQCHTVVHC